MTIAEWRLLIDDRRIDDCGLQIEGASAHSRLLAAHQGSQQAAVQTRNHQSTIRRSPISTHQSTISVPCRSTVAASNQPSKSQSPINDPSIVNQQSPISNW
jgi:hypothetical protein